MALPAELTFVSVTGQLAPSPGPYAAKFVSRHVLVGTADDLVVAPFTVHAEVDADGAFTVLLPATNDPAWSPVGWEYVVYLAVGAQVIRGALAVDYAGGSFDLADRLNVDPAYAETGTSYVLLAARGAANGVAALDATGKVPAEQLPASAGGDPDWSEITGKPATFPPELPIAMADVTGLTSGLAAKADNADLADLADLTADALALKAPLASPALTGNPTAPTQTAGNDSTRLATTAFVTAAVAAVEGGGGGSAMVVRRAVVSSGNITPQNTGGSWAALTGGPTLTIPAAVGDYLSVEVMGVLMTKDAATFWDLAVLNATPVRYGSSGTSTPAAEGDGSFYPDTNFPRSGTVFDFVAEAGDISAGTVTACWAVKSGGAGQLHAGFYPLRWRIINHGPVDVA